jgi:hypothetical protein
MKGVKPQYISPSVESISITLQDVNGTSPGPLTGNPAMSNISSATCSSGCTVAGPPSPVGSDTFVLTTYDASSGSGNALETATGTYTVAQGNNTESITLEGIPASFSIGNVPAPSADGTLSSTIGGPANAGIEVSVFDADGDTITGTYANAVTVTDPDENSDGSSFQAVGCPGAYPVGNTGGFATTATLTSDTSAEYFCYGGIAENPQTLAASASGATSGTANFQPVLAVPAELAGSATPASVASDSDGNGRGDIALFEPSGGGTGSTGSVTYTEAGWTDYPYEQPLDAFANLACSSGSSFSDYGNVGSAANGSSGTIVTVSAITSPTAAACPLTISDALLSNSTDSNGLGDGVPLVELDSSYTTSSFSVNNHGRKH